MGKKNNLQESTRVGQGEHATCQSAGALVRAQLHDTEAVRRVVERANSARLRRLPLHALLRRRRPLVRRLREGGQAHLSREHAKGLRQSESQDRSRSLLFVLISFIFTPKIKSTDDCNYYQSLDPILKNFINRVPSAVEVEVDKVINSAESFTPDACMIMGEAAEVLLYLK